MSLRPFAAKEATLVGVASMSSAKEQDSSHTPPQGRSPLSSHDSDILSPSEIERLRRKSKETRDLAAKAPQKTGTRPPPLTCGGRSAAMTREAGHLVDLPCAGTTSKRSMSWVMGSSNAP